MADVVTQTQMISPRGDFDWESSGLKQTVWIMNSRDKYLVPFSKHTTLWFSRVKLGSLAEITIKTFLDVDGLTLPDVQMSISNTLGATAPIAMLDEAYVNTDGYYEITCDQDAEIQMLPHMQDPGYM